MYRCDERTSSTSLPSSSHGQEQEAVSLKGTSHTTTCLPEKEFYTVTSIHIRRQGQDLGDDYYAIQYPHYKRYKCFITNITT